MNNETILVIEDEKPVRENIATLLEEEGYKVFAVPSGKEGITKALEIIPDLILCDIMMKLVDGYNVLKTLSQNNSTRTIPFLFLTAKVEREDIRLGMELGADDYLFKPFRAEELLNAIKVRLNKRNILTANLNKTKEAGLDKYSIEDKIFMDVKDKPGFIAVKDIKYITAENQYTLLKLTNDRSFLIRRTIKSWEDSLPPQYFLRIHRSTIININFIAKMEKWHNSSFLIYLNNVAEPFFISKKYSAAIRKSKI